MYIADAQTRMGYVQLRWQIAIPFMAANVALVGLLYSVFVWESALHGALNFGICSLGGANTYAWQRLFERINNWIRFHTARLEDMERAQGTESGVLIFSHPQYLSRPDGDEKRDRSTFHKILKRTIGAQLILWTIGAIVFAFLAGHWALEGKL